ncbi:MAG: porin family protein [Saprospiraceae bacterium]
MNYLKAKSILSYVIIAYGFLFMNSLEAQRAEIGLRLMPTFSAADVINSAGGKIEGEVTLGYGIGGLLGFNFSKHIGVQGELIYNSISQKYKEQDVERRIKLNYINIPLLLSLNSGKTNLVNFNVVAGPQMGISVGSRLETNGTSGTDSTNAVLAVKKGDLGLAYGAGIDIGVNPSQSLRLSLGYRGILGLFDVSDDSQTLNNNSYFILEKTHIKTNSIYVGISYLF